MSNKLEQPSGIFAEVNKIADKTSPENKLPEHIAQCINLVSVPDIESKHEPDVRCFYMSDSRVFFGIVFFETSDSFLVGASSRLVMEVDKSIVCEPLLPVPVTRLLKTSVCMVTPPVPKYKYHYFTYLKSKGPALLPDYLKGDTLDKVSDFIQNFKDDDKDNKTVSFETSLKEEFERKGVHGMSDFAFALPHGSDKIH